MTEHSVSDEIAEALVGLTPDVLEPILDAMADVVTEARNFTHDEVVELVRGAISATAGAAAGAAVRHYLDQRRPELESALRRALAVR
jgi:hypothetical protein